MFEFKLPDIGEGIAEAEIVTWLVSDGDYVKKDAPLMEVMTDKATAELSTPVAGTIVARNGNEGDIVPVGHVLVRIDDGTASPKKASPRPSSAKQSVKRKKTRAGKLHDKEKSDLTKATGTEVSSSVSANPLHRAVPAVRAYAKQRGVDLAACEGSGPEGRIMKADVDAVLTGARPGANGRGEVERQDPVQALPSKPDPDDWTREPLKGIRRVIADHMHQSKSILAHYTYVDECDVTRVEAAREAAANQGRDGYTSILPIVAVAACRQLHVFPYFNASIDNVHREIVLKRRIHLGFAVETEAGLMVPVIRDADRLGIEGMAMQMRDLALRARKKTLKLSELSGSTFSITSLGKLGGILGTPIINYPESAILGLHAIRTLPRYQDEKVVPRQVMNLSLSLDHRLVDGHAAAMFINGIKQQLHGLDFDEFKTLRSDDT